LVSLVLALAFPYNKSSPNQPPVWVALVIVFGVAFAVTYARAK